MDGGHPFALALRAAAEAAAAEVGIPCLRFARAVQAPPPGASLAADHAQAAALAFAGGGPVLLTTGSRELLPYVREARRRGAALTARVLDHPESLAACAAAGLCPSEIEAGRPPFSLAADRALLARTGARALVTKDSGEAGGVARKAQAAREAGARLVILRRPEDAGLDLSALRARLLEVRHASL